MPEQNTLTAKEFCALHVSVGFVPLDEEQVADALRGSLVTFNTSKTAARWAWAASSATVPAAPSQLA